MSQATSQKIGGGIWDQALDQRYQVTLSLQACLAETLGCFPLELSVIGLEEGPSIGTAVFCLQCLLGALRPQLWVRAQGPYALCEEHPRRPAPLFLARLLELLQGAYAQRLPSTQALEDADSLVLLDRRVERESWSPVRASNPKPSPSRPEDTPGEEEPKGRGEKEENNVRSEA